MKINIKGFVIEGSVEEIKELIELEEGKTKKEKTFYISSSKSVLENENRYVTPKYKKSNPETDKRVIRMKFISRRIKHYMHENGMNYEKAMRMGIDEWNFNKKATITTKTFPVFQTCQHNKILQDIVERVIKNRVFLCFINDGYSLGIENIKEWHRFTIEFMKLSKDISNYFNAENKFRYEIGSAKIIYG